MLSVVALALAVLPAFTLGATLAPYSQNDFDILNYALALENLENQFYASALAKFTDSFWTDKSQYATFKLIAQHEAAHTSFLTDFLKAQGQTPVVPCSTYAFPLNDVATFVATAKVIENVGVRAYTGAVEYFAVGPAAQAAASIATIEARHATYLNIITKNLPIPSAYDSPLGQRSVLSLAASFVDMANGNSNLCLPPKIIPYPSAPFTPATGPAGTVLTLDLSKLNNTSTANCVFVFGTGNTTVPIDRTGPKPTCTVPAGVVAEAVVLIAGNVNYQYSGLSIAQALSSSASSLNNDDLNIIGVGGVFQIPGNFTMGSSSASSSGAETMIQGISVGALTFALMSFIAFVGF